MDAPDPAPAAGFVDIAHSAEIVAEDAGAVAGALNTAPITLAAVAKECRATAITARQFEVLQQGGSDWGWKPSEFVSTADKLARSMASELSTLIESVGRLARPRSRGGADLVIVWNEGILKHCVESLKASRCSLEFLLECVPGEHTLNAPSPPKAESPLVSPALVNLGNRLRLSMMAATPLQNPGHAALSRVCIEESREVVAGLAPDPGKVQRRARQFCQLLHLAIDKKKGPAVLELLHQRVDPTAPLPGSAVSPLHRALGHKDEYITTLLVAAGADIEELDDSGSTALIRGVRNGFSDKFAALMCEMGANVNAVDNRGESCLHIVAASDRDDDCIGILIEAGADANSKDAQGLTPLATAVSKGRLRAVRRLVEHGADIEARMPGGKTVLHLAIANRDADMCRLLAELGAFLDQSFGDHTPLTYAISSASFDIAEMLIESGADVNRQSKSGHFGLLAAVSAGSKSLTSTLLSHSAAVWMASSCGYLAVHMAAHKNRVDILKLLVKGGSQVDPVTNDGDTPLWIAVKLGNRECVDSLVQLGADVNHGVPSGDSMLATAVGGGNLPIAKTLISAGADAGAVVADDNGYDTTPLHLAAARGLDDIVRAMAQAGASLDVEVWPGNTPLFSAARAGNLSTARLLVERGANIKAESAAGEQVLFVCTAHAALLKFFLGQGVKVNHRDHHGATALHHAGIHGHYAAAKLLLQQGARSLHANAVYDCLDDFKMGSRYRQGTPAGVARQKGHFKVAKLIDGWKYKP